MHQNAAYRATLPASLPPLGMIKDVMLTGFWGNRLKTVERLWITVNPPVDA